VIVCKALIAALMETLSCISHHLRESSVKAATDATANLLIAFVCFYISMYRCQISTAKE
jgi:hypothetical protein